LQVAADAADAFPDGIYFIDLSPIREPEAALSALYQVFEIQETSNTPDIKHLKEHLYRKKILLLLDNFEQIMQATPLVHELLTSCTDLKILTTSRALLHLEGEHEYYVSPLAIPDMALALDLKQIEQYEAVTLFTQQARSVKPDFQLTEANASAVIAICNQ